MPALIKFCQKTMLLPAARTDHQLFQRHPGSSAYVLKLILRCEVSTAYLAGGHLEVPSPDRPDIAGRGGVHLDLPSRTDIGAGAAADADIRRLVKRGADILLRATVGKPDRAHPDDLLACPDAQTTEDAF